MMKNTYPNQHSNSCGQVNVISLLGNISLMMALLFSALQSFIPLWGYWYHNPYALACARPSAWGQCIAVCSAYVFITVAFITNDFSIAYVAANSHSSLPIWYKFTAVWGAHEGSILLWTLMLAIWTIVFTLIKKNTRSRKDFPLALAILGLISLCFLSFLLLTSNPFAITHLPSTGHDLNPLLQDPGFIIHPPMLYMGYVGFSVTFAITQAALLSNQLDKQWAQITRYVTTIAWICLTLGIVLGSWWAYRVLGWGGFWFWDPVENASLLPWLVGIALIHVLILTERRGIAINWVTLLTIICFFLSLLGTFLVRSGVLISVHTFANDPLRGSFLLLLLVLLMTAALITYIVRFSQANSISRITLSWHSRDTSLLINSVLLVVGMCTILLGTLYPLIMDALNLDTLSVGAPYFNQTMTPLVIFMMLLMGWGPSCHWQMSRIPSSWQSAAKKLTISMISAIFFLWLVIGQVNIILLLTLSTSLWVIASVIDSIRSIPGMTLAHIGFAILIIGITLSSHISQEREIRIKPGDITPIGPYQFHFLSTKGISGINYRGIQARFVVTKNKRQITTLYPEKRIYTVRDMIITKVDIHPGLFRDLYIALGEPLSNDYWSVRIYYKPFIRWIWSGGIIMMIGAMFALKKQKRQYA
jgi:cytochrome c-type biogenesis protein CcmF